jgi:hypothetical protein
MSVLGAIVDSKEQHTDNIGQMVKAVADLVQPQGTSAAAVAPDTRRSMASMFLSRLEADEGVCEDDEAMRVLEEAARVLHGSAQGPAERMSSRICVMDERALPPLECVVRLRTFLQRDAARTTTGTVHSIGDGAGVSAAE